MSTPPPDALPPVAPPTSALSPVASPSRRTKARAEGRRAAMAALAARQHGVVARRQLLELGLSDSEITRLVAAGWLHPLHGGVFLLGHPGATRLARHQAATLAFGERTAVSHRPSVVLRGLLPDRGDPVEVTTACGNAGWHGGVRVHECRRLSSRDVVRVQGIWAVRLERAVVDVAGSEPSELARLLAAIDRKRLLDPRALARELRSGRRGSSLVRLRLEELTERPPTESELEDLFIEAIVGARGLPDPVHQASPLPLRAQRVDFAWPQERVVVEVDGRVWHAIQSTWGEDHERDLALRRAGWTCLRYTHRQLTKTPALVADDLQAALGPDRPLLRPPGARSSGRKLR